LGADVWDFLPHVHPEDGTDSKSGSFGGLVFAAYFPTQRITHTRIISLDTRPGSASINNTFPAREHFQLFKTKNLIPQFFRQQLYRLYTGPVVLCVFTRHAGCEIIRR